MLNRGGVRPGDGVVADTPSVVFMKGVQGSARERREVRSRMRRVCHCGDQRLRTGACSEASVAEWIQAIYPEARRAAVKIACGKSSPNIVYVVYVVLLLTSI